VRLLGVRITNLRHQGDQQLPLFPRERKRALATYAMDAVNARFGDKVIFGSLLSGEESTKGSHVISPAWRPDGIRNINCK
jgi:DNA polymerase-4